MNNQLNSVDSAIDCFSDKIMSGVYDRIGREHTLFSARMGWLLTVNSILFAPVFLTVRLLENPSNQAYNMLFAICLLGAFITFILSIPMALAIYTIGVLKKREDLIYRHLESRSMSSKASVFRLIDVDKTISKSSVISEWPRRFEYTHSVSMCLQILVPVVVFIGWLVCFNLLATSFA